MGFPVEFFNLIGSLICHQLPERTIYADGLPLPVCARDTGIYLGIFASMLVIILLGRFRSDMTPNVPASIVLCLFMASMLIDGFGSYLGLYRTNNIIRLLTGTAFGLAIPFFLIPAAYFNVNGSNTKPVLKDLRELALVLATAGALCAAVLAGLLPYLAVSVIFTSSFIFLTGRIMYTIVVRIGLFDGRRLLVTAAASLCAMSVLYLLSSCILKPLKVMLLK